MLTGIHVKNLALIDEIEVDFSPNLNILTGETGAGKSIVIGSVNAALGKKVSKDMIRKGAKEALVELFFDVKDEHILQYLDEIQVPVQDSQVIVSRRITPARSVNRINGEIVSAAAIKALGEMLVDIHGQHEHQSLLHKHHHLEILDFFSKWRLKEKKEVMAKSYDRYMDLKRELDQSVVDEEARRRDISFLEFEQNEIASARLSLGEDDLLTAQYKKMSNSRQIMEAVSSAYRLTGYESGAGDEVGRALRELIGVEDYDEELAGFRQQLEDIDNLVNDFNREISGYMSQLSFDDDEFHQVEQRLDLINGLKAKYGQTIEDILAYGRETEKKLDKLKNYDIYLDHLRKDVEKAREELKKISEEVSQIRRSSGEKLAQEITQALKDLNFLDVRFGWKFDRLPDYTRNGIDDACFMISTNPGEDMKPLAQVASGGELSRIMLAIKSVLADVDSIETLIFDEIDAGISGRTAQKVSEKLALISRKHQVLCITHLPQIAAMADNHYRIEKEPKGALTTTHITPLDHEMMVEEIARLLGGVQITDTVLENAREMKALADQLKSGKVSGK
ncbi:DNA repair protein RecN (Recombination protein N) [Catenibacillus scindens]|uniref:DNA repair protein RecN n=1 Tax=Catenibacillus scindens TaxID=673271 RepID=A0A7W8H9Q0_9FIRM|nr:DNA repair protein RecN [Catenibacillus scindens]MBB5264486.1 DNA repair protein RecN (Recombination protein N) [Catenibacillus scindens]